MATRGYTMGIVGMCVGEKRIIVAPSDLAFGAKGKEDPKVPPHTPIEFHVHLTRILSEDEDY
jgi:FK506-binding protein 2